MPCLSLFLDCRGYPGKGIYLNQWRHTHFLRRKKSLSNHSHLVKGSDRQTETHHLRYSVPHSIPSHSQPSVYVSILLRRDAKTELPLTDCTASIPSVLRTPYSYSTVNPVPSRFHELVEQLAVATGPGLPFLHRNRATPPYQERGWLIAYQKDKVPVRQGD